MANRNSPSGFVPVRHSAGGEIRTESVDLKSTNSEIGIGDPLALDSSGTYDLWASGAIAGFAAEYKAANAGSGATILAYTDPQIVYSAQTDDGTGTLTAQTGQNLNATIVTGTVSNRRSIAEIDESSGNTTATLPLKVLGLSKAVGNAYGEFNRLDVIINNHVRKGGTGTAGV